MRDHDANFVMVAHYPDNSDCVVKAQGKLDLRAAVRFQEALLEAVVSSPTRLIVDLKDVNLIDDLGADVLRHALNRARDSGTTLMLQGPLPNAMAAEAADDL